VGCRTPAAHSPANSSDDHPNVHIGVLQTLPFLIPHYRAAVLLGLAVMAF